MNSYNSWNSNWPNRMNSHRRRITDSPAGAADYDRTSYKYQTMGISNYTSTPTSMLRKVAWGMQDEGAVAKKGSTGAHPHGPGRHAGRRGTTMSTTPVSSTTPGKMARISSTARRDSNRRR